MQINSIQNYNLNKNTPLFRGPVLPEFVKYVNELREDCLQTVPKHSANLINNVCDSILQTSDKVMKHFPPTSVLTIDTERMTNCITPIIKNGIVKKYEQSDGFLGCVPDNPIPSKKLLELRTLIKGKSNIFLQQSSREIRSIYGLFYFQFSKINDYNVYNEFFSDMTYLLNWWHEHLDAVVSFSYFGDMRLFISNTMSQLTKRREELMQNRPLIPRKDLKSVTEHLWEHLRETVYMPKADEIYDGRKTEYEMKKLEDELVPSVVKDMQAGKIDKEDIMSASSDLNDYHIYEIEGTKNCYRGPLEYSDIDILKPLGLKVIDIGYTTNGYFTGNIGQIVDFIKSMQGGSVYFGCMNGVDRTKKAVSLDYYFNPLQKHNYAGGFSPDDYDDLLDLCDKLTPEQKKEMQWTEEFEKELRAKLQRAKDFYINNQ